MRGGALVSLLLLSAGALAADDLHVQIVEYDVPTPGSRPHDPALAPDGALWYTGQAANKLGRLDPNTGQILEFPLKTPKSGPHGLAADASGNIWFTAISGGYVGKLDPKTGQVTEYRMPDPAANDPHPRVRRQGNPLVHPRVVGLRRPPRSRQRQGRRQEGAHRARGSLWHRRRSRRASLFLRVRHEQAGEHRSQDHGHSRVCIAQWGPAPPPGIGAGRDDLLLDYARGYLGHFDPASGKVEEWPSPGGAGSHPYGIAVTPDGKVWYSESGVSPNTLVGFDPTTKSFGARAIPSGGGVVRNMVATPDGRLYLACSGVNKVAIVKPLP
jgi:virginiamycin B lyase